MARVRYGGHSGRDSWCRESGVDILRRDGRSRGRCRDEDLQQSCGWDLQKDGRSRDGKMHTKGGASNPAKHDPGELASDSSSEVEDGFKKPAHVDEASSGKKRKYSLVVRDLVDKKDSVINLKSRNEDIIARSSPHPVLRGSYKHIPAKRIKTSKKLLTSVDMDFSIVSFRNKWMENGDQPEPLGVDNMPERTMACSRWVKDIIEVDVHETYEEKLTNNRKNGTHLTPSLDESLESGEVISSEGSDASASSVAGYGGLCHEASLENFDSLVYGKCAFGEESYSKDNVGSFEIDVEGGRVNRMWSGKPTCARINMLQGCRSVDEFEKLNKINEGTYGIVYRARDKKTGEIVALKKVKMGKEEEGFPLTSLREINILFSLQHPSIVEVKEVVMGRTINDIFMVMEYMDFDLEGLLRTIKRPFHISEIKCLMLQLLAGIKYLHDNWLLHRDLKTSNLLFNNFGELKICDFGLSRQYGSPSKSYTQLVVTLWYRAPELLLGANKYSTAIDMWSLGCIMAEILSKEPLFPGKNEVDQLNKIFCIMGTPDDKSWPEFSRLPGAKVKFPKKPFKLHEKFHLMSTKSFLGYPLLSDAGFDLLNRLLTYDPDKRITAEDALNHPWFREYPLPTTTDLMPTFLSQLTPNRCKQSFMKTTDRLQHLGQRDALYLGNADYFCQIGLLLLHNGEICCGIIWLITSDS
ncbi:hypothetical protein HPP92_023901 [Vanilla planifolia]|uniref:Protein kinase domain-containing protein n=1 Tax=Vanilla planifolia TaxID=51239 RepID=A0A835UCF5_VANPL|nr:hypothetical protein HPP92_023901 [Vanilla planifolia]